MKNLHEKSNAQILDSVKQEIIVIIRQLNEIDSKRKEIETMLQVVLDRRAEVEAEMNSFFNSVEGLSGEEEYLANNQEEKDGSEIL